MPMGDLFERGTLFEFMLRNIDSYAFSSDCWLLIHIPKTAGSSAREELANVLQPDFNIEVDYGALNAADLDGDFDTKLREAVNSFADSPHFEKYRFVSGHVPCYLIRANRKFDRFRKVTFLREPVSRLISDYRYRTSPENPTSEAEKRRFPDFESFVAAETNQNVMFRYLRLDDRSDPTAEDVIEFMLNEFAFVGVQETYPLSIHVLFSLLGKRINPTIRLRSADRSAEDWRRDEQFAPALDFAMKSNAKDVIIYDYFVSRFQRLRGKLFEEIDYGRALKRINGLPYPTVK